jgi:hypothetical protein
VDGKLAPDDRKVIISDFRSSNESYLDALRTWDIKSDHPHRRGKQQKTA